MPEVTLEHVKAAAEWAELAAEPSPIDGLVRKYDQSRWDCGTSCCIWGAASIIAGNGPAGSGPSDEWMGLSVTHAIVCGLMRSGKSAPAQILAILRDADLRGADLRDADLRGADLRDADLRDADLRDADLRGADLRGADLRDADLRDADLRDADLRDADLRDADPRDADLRGADLSGVIVLVGNVAAIVK